MRPASRAAAAVAVAAQVVAAQGAPGALGAAVRVEEAMGKLPWI